jgi:hypothetical protein
MQVGKTLADKSFAGSRRSVEPGHRSSLLSRRIVVEKTLGGFSILWF